MDTLINQLTVIVLCLIGIGAAVLYSNYQFKKKEKK